MARAAGDHSPANWTLNLQLGIEILISSLRGDHIAGRANRINNIGLFYPSGKTNAGEINRSGIDPGGDLHRITLGNWQGS